MAEEYARMSGAASGRPAVSVAIRVSEEASVSGLLITQEGAKAGLVLAHGAGAGMTHPFMAALASGLAERGVATLRYQFTYMERGSRRPDPPATATAVVRAAANVAVELLPKLSLFAGGKSFGGRMTSQAQAYEALPGVRGLVFFGFPLHPAGKPSTQRAEHLAEVRLPMLFLQGSRDTLAGLDLLRPMVERLGHAAVLHEVDGADHGFHVPKRGGHSDEQTLGDVLDVATTWMTMVARVAEDGTDDGQP